MSDICPSATLYIGKFSIDYEISSIGSLKNIHNTGEVAMV